MYLSSIEKIPNDVAVVLMYTPAIEMDIFAFDKIVKYLGTTREYIQEIKSIKDLHRAEMNSTVSPFGCNNWVFKINIDKQERVLKELPKSLEVNSSGLYYVVTSKYFMYKKAIETLKEYRILDLNMGYMNLDDIVFIYDNTVDKDKRINSALFSFFAENYSTDVEAVFKLFEALQNGESVESKKDIVNICGLANNTIPIFTVKLIDSKLNSDFTRKGKDLTDEKVARSVDLGRKRIIKNKMKQVVDMLDVYNWRYIYTVMLNTVRALRDLKILYINGILYKKHLDYTQTEGYDDKQLARGMKFWYRIHELPLSELNLLVAELEKKVWEGRMDFEMFLYNYYK